jgi:hypothetical protein
MKTTLIQSLRSEDFISALLGTSALRNLSSSLGLNLAVAGKSEFLRECGEVAMCECCVP